jgi:hypothetical protein
MPTVFGRGSVTHMRPAAVRAANPPFPPAAMGACLSVPERYPRDDPATAQLPSLGRTRASDDQRLVAQSTYDRRRDELETQVRVLCGGVGRTGADGMPRR